ncbi:MAG: transposase, partial [Hyphomicrobiales bacterium]|nr:transposase [Hyphomicrobiales bacterium]
APLSGVIVAIAMTDRRNDQGLATPMVDEIARRYGKTPDRLLVDTGYATHDDIAGLERHHAGPVTVFAPPPVERTNIKPESRRRRERRRAQEPECVKRWRERMASAAGKAVYALRKRIERVNADRKNHGFGFLPVRGLLKAKAIALWHALAHNLVAAHRLRGAIA